MIRQEANMFFPQPPIPLPSTPPSTTQTAVSSTPTTQQPNIQRVELSSSVDSTQDGARAFGTPMYQTTDHSLPKAFFSAIPSTPTAPLQENRPLCAGPVEEQEDVEMESADYLSSAAPKSTITGTSKGLASSIWNPVNRNAGTDSECNRQAPFKAGSDTTKKTQIVTSGITKGPGLKASRWCD
ncbi:hypothetical protein GGR58DRAFT_204987 [Xylaria digitata]|nr:hypothetical protein GGR58DRAFT_204987 [Xylaria digitata]